MLPPVVRWRRVWKTQASRPSPDRPEIALERASEGLILVLPRLMILVAGEDVLAIGHTAGDPLGVRHRIGLILSAYSQHEAIPRETHRGDCLVAYDSERRTTGSNRC